MIIHIKTKKSGYITRIFSALGAHQMTDIRHGVLQISVGRDDPGTPSLSLGFHMDYALIVARISRQIFVTVSRRFSTDESFAVSNGTAKWLMLKTAVTP